MRLPPDARISRTCRAGSTTSSSTRRTSARLRRRASTSTSSGAARRRPPASSRLDSTARTCSTTRTPGSNRRLSPPPSARAARTAPSPAIGSTRSSTGPMGHGARRWPTTSSRVTPSLACDGDSSGCTTRNVGSYTVWDLQGRYTGFRNMTLTLGIRNALDTPPPVSNQSNSVPGGNRSLLRRPARPDVLRRDSVCVQVGHS